MVLRHSCPDHVTQSEETTEKDRGGRWQQTEMHGFVYTQIVGAFPMDIGHLSHGQLTMFNYLKLY